MTTRPAWQTPWTAVGECHCRWDLYFASCPKPWHRELSTHDGRNTVDLPSAPDFRTQGWGAGL